MPLSKEQEVLEQQRRLALSLKQKKLRQQQEQKVSEAKKHAPKQGATTAAAASALMKRPSSHKPIALKRPSVNQRTTAQSLKRPADVLAAAREKAARGSVAGDLGDLTDQNESTTDTPTGTAKRRKVLTAASSCTTHLSNFTASESVASLPKLTKKTGKALSAFSSLVATAKTSSSTARADDISSTTLPNVDPEDFWKHLRDWDFCQQVHQQLEQQKQPNKVRQIEQQQHQQQQQDDSEAPATSTKTLPDVFLSPRHYVAAWAPLCLAETRAQILSDWLSDLGRQQRSGAPVTAIMTDNRGPVRRGPGIIRNDPYLINMRLEPEDSVCLRLVCKGASGGGDLSFVTNDIVLLVPIKYKDLFIGVLNGKYTPTPDEALSDNPFKKWGVVVGHTKCTRKTPHDLIVEVSKRKWALVPTQTGTLDSNNKRGEEAELWLWKLGSNVTALREFTALCRMDLLPLKRFLLGQHLDPHNAAKPTKLQNNNRNNDDDDKSDLLEKMGGSQALGKGFTSYAKNKFNPSQLLAIAASAHEYGEGGFTLIKGPPGTGKTTTLVAVLNSLHIRQYNKYYDQVRQIAKEKKNRQFALELARKSKPRLLVCAPSNTAVDNIILKIMEDGFVDGQGKRYNPSMIRIGVGQSGAIRRAVSLEQKVDAIFSEYQDLTKLESTMERHRTELQHLNAEITKCRRRIHAIEDASPWPLSKSWEIRVDEENFDTDFDAGGGRVYFVNHHEKMTTFQVPPPPEPGEQQYPATAMPEYRVLMASVVKLVEQCFTIKTQLERCTIVKGSIDNGANHMQVRTTLELHVLNSVHMIMTTLGTAGGRTLEGVDKFEVVVIDEAAQSVEPATLAALQLGSRHCVLVGDPQQLPATIFNVSGKTTKYDRSLFQRLEEAHQPVYMLDEQYRMHPKISHFPRHIFYGGTLRDGPNVLKPDYGNPVRDILSRQMPLLQPFTILDLDSTEERGGTSLSNSQEAHLAVYLYTSLNELTGGLLKQSKVAIITPYAQQTKLLCRSFENALGPRYENFVEVNTVDAYQGREANVVIFSAVRAAGSRGIGFLSDVRRMNVALTRAKHFLFVIARCKSIVVNPYWYELVQHAREQHAVLRVPIHQQGKRNLPVFGNPQEWQLEDAARPYVDNAPMMIGSGNVEAALADLAALSSGKPADPRRNNNSNQNNRNGHGNNHSNANVDAALADLAALAGPGKPKDPRQGSKKSGNSNSDNQRRNDPRRQANRPPQGKNNPRNNDNRPHGTNPSLNHHDRHGPANNNSGAVMTIPPPPPPPPPPNPGRGYIAPIGVPPPPPPLIPQPPPPPPPPPPSRAIDPRQRQPSDPRKRGY